MKLRSILVLCCLLLSAWPTIAAPPKLNYLFPAGAARGQTIQVTASGSFSNWPVEAWVDRPGIVVKAEKAKGKLSVTVSPDAEAGDYWLRVYDREGSSTLRPFLVDSLPEVSEKEPNDDLNKPQKLKSSSIINGKLAKRGDVDGFAIVLKKHQTLIASLEANRQLGSPMDGVLQISSTDGFVLQQNDDERGLDPLIVFQAPCDGTYIVRTFAFPATPNSTIGFAGADNYVYRLTVTTGGMVDHTIPLSLTKETFADVQLYGWNIVDSVSRITASAKGDATRTVSHPSICGATELPVVDHRSIVAQEACSLNEPQPIELPVVITGRIESHEDEDTFQFKAQKGQNLRFHVEARNLGFPLDAVLKLTDLKGKVLSEVDDPSRGKPDPILSYTIRADGEYRLSIRDLHEFGGLRYVYRLTAEEAKPSFSLALKADSFVLTPGKPLEIPVTITRDKGFSKELEITAVGLPNGVTVQAAKSLAKGSSAKSVKLKLTAPRGPIHSSFRVVGRTTGQQSATTARFPISAGNAQHTEAWLTVLEKK